MESNRKDGQRKEEQRTGSYREDGVREESLWEEETSFGKRGWEECPGNMRLRMGGLGKKKGAPKSALPCQARRADQAAHRGTEVLAGVPVVVLVGTVHGTGLVDVVALEGERLACFPTSRNLPDVAVQTVGVGQGVVPAQSSTA